VVHIFNDVAVGSQFPDDEVDIYHIGLEDDGLDRGCPVAADRAAGVEIVRSQAFMMSEGERFARGEVHLSDGAPGGHDGVVGDGPSVILKLTCLIVSFMFVSPQKRTVLKL